MMLTVISYLVDELGSNTAADGYRAPEDAATSLILAVTRWMGHLRCCRLLQAENPLQRVAAGRPALSSTWSPTRISETSGDTV